MYVENAIEIFYNAMMGKSTLAVDMLRDQWACDFIKSLHASVLEGKTLSTEQGRVFLKTLNKYRNHFPANVLKLIDAPYYKNAPYQSKIIPNEVRYLGGNYLGFRFKKNDNIRADLKKISDKNRRSTLKRPSEVKYHSFLRIWVVELTRENFKDIVAIIGRHDFKFDDDVLEYLTLADNSTGQKSTFVVDPETGNIIANICDNAILLSWIKTVIFGQMA